MQQSLSKLDLSESEMLCADKGYDSESLRKHIQDSKTKPNIPRKSKT